MAVSFITSYFRKSSNRRYSDGDDSSMSEKELEPFLFETPKTKEKSSSSLRIILLLLFSTLGFAALSLYFYLKTLSPPLGTFEKGWKTDFGPAREYVSTKQVQFTGSPAFDADENYFVPHPDPIKYVGEPSEEIDRAWEDITWGRYILITKEEAIATLSDQFGDVQQFWSPKRGGYIGGFDMFHTLHCLNRIRQDLHPEYYKQKPHPNHKIHQSHCIEQIRQYIMCAGDMALTPTRYHPGRKSSYIDSDVKHTCRNFGSLREFLSERFNGSKAVQPICPEDKTFPEEGSRSCVIHD